MEKLTVLFEIVKMIPKTIINLFTGGIYLVEKVVLPIVLITPTKKDDEVTNRVILWLETTRAKIEAYSASFTIFGK